MCPSQIQKRNGIQLGTMFLFKFFVSILSFFFAFQSEWTGLEAGGKEFSTRDHPPGVVNKQLSTCYGNRTKKTLPQHNRNSHECTPRSERKMGDKIERNANNCFLFALECNEIVYNCITRGSIMSNNFLSCPFYPATWNWIGPMKLDKSLGSLPCVMLC